MMVCLKLRLGNNGLGLLKTRVLAVNVDFISQPFTISPEPVSPELRLNQIRRHAPRRCLVH